PSAFRASGGTSPAVEIAAASCPGSGRVFLLTGRGLYKPLAGVPAGAIEVSAAPHSPASEKRVAPLSGHGMFRAQECRSRLSCDVKANNAGDAMHVGRNRQILQRREGLRIYPAR